MRSSRCAPVSTPWKSRLPADTSLCSERRLAMPQPSSLARPRGKPRCEILEGRILLAASLDYPRFTAALFAAWEAVTSSPPAPVGPFAPLASPSRALDVDLNGDGILDRIELTRPEGASTDRFDVFLGLADGSLEPVRQTMLGYVA